jgi:hypothetical protein
MGANKADFAAGLYHGSRSTNLGGFVFPQGEFAYATTDPEQARLYGETKFTSPEDADKPVKVYRVSPVQPDEAETYDGEKPGEKHVRTRQGFMIMEEHHGSK